MKHRNRWLLSVSFSTLTLFALGLSRPTLTFAVDPKTNLAPAPQAPAPVAPPKEAPKETSEKLQEIQVTLFGQPCTMNGPFPRGTLTLLHEISPEKVPPTASLDLMKRIRTKTTQLKSIPFPLEQYRDHLRKRLSALIALEEALAVAKASKPQASRKALDSLLTNLKEHISTLQFPAFAEATKKSFEANAAMWNPLFIEPLRERYGNVIQPETEEEFHKSIRLSKIQYICVFDDGADHSNTEEETE